MCDAKAIKSKRIVVKYMEKYSILSSKNNVNFICDDIERYRDIQIELYKLYNKHYTEYNKFMLFKILYKR